MQYRLNEAPCYRILTDLLKSASRQAAHQEIDQSLKCYGQHSEDFVDLNDDPPWAKADRTIICA
jgi:hypothetical protein